jgi:hypothetical protein
MKLDFAVERAIMRFKLYFVFVLYPDIVSGMDLLGQQNAFVICGVFLLSG